MRAETDLVEDLELLGFDEAVEEVIVDLVRDLVGKVEEVKSKREGGRREEEGLVVEAKSNEGEEVEESLGRRGRREATRKVKREDVRDGLQKRNERWSCDKP